MAGEWKSSTVGQWTGVDWATFRAAGFLPDPYFVWADITNFSELGGPPQRWLTVIMELKVSAKEFAQFVQDSADPSWIRVFDVYRLPGPRLENVRYCTAIVHGRFFGELSRLLADKVARFELGLSVIAPTATTPHYDPGHSPPGTVAGTLDSAAEARQAPQGRVFVGVIDDGLPFAHGRFLMPDGGTRVEALWNQEELENSVFRAPVGIPYGHEITKHSIDGMLHAPLHKLLRDEDRVYAEAMYGALSRRSAHGAHVMDLACGLDAKEVKPGATPRILAVHLPTGHTSDTSSRSLSAHALDAIRYVIDRADAFATGGAAQVVINMSYGNIAGPHDGSSILESAMDELVEARGGDLAIVLPVGNSFQSRCHAEVELAATGEASKRALAWRVLPDDQTPSFLEVWLLDGAHGATVSVTPPGGASSGPVPAGDVRVLEVDGKVVGSVVHLRTPGTGKNEMIAIAISPTHRVDPGDPLAPAGTWTVEIANTSAKPMKVASWIQRDDSPYGVKVRGRQSRFEDAEYVRYQDDGRESEVDRPKACVKRAGSLSGIATGSRTITVGAFTRLPISPPPDAMDGEPASYSSSGPGVGAVPRQPNVLGVSEDSPSRHGVLGAGTRTGALVRMNGTSVTAPRVARWLAERFVRGLPADAAALEAEADTQENLRVSPRFHARPSRDRGGRGRLDLSPVHDRRDDWK